MPEIPDRRGATLVESALTLPLLLLLIFGTIDLGIAVQRAALCHEVARIGARMAVVHGADARESGVWSADQAVEAIHGRIDPILEAAAIDPASVQVLVTWQKGGSGPYLNSPGSFVTVQVSIPHRSAVSFLRLPALTVSSDSRMVISN
ncbi:MAG: TadE/TadG family type IV pilus assembly protein [Planctomycetota bacterium]